MRLEAAHVSFRYGRKGPWILEDLSLAVESGQRLGLFAPSGYGKSTLAFSRGRTPPDHNFGDTGKPCKFRNLIRNILSIDGFDMRAKLPCQPNILPQPFLVIFIHFSSGGGGKVPTECPCHPCSGADDLRVGWRG